jgi:hypothetical protein
MKRVNEIAAEFGKAYASTKLAEKNKSRLQREFFDAINLELLATPLAQKTVECNLTDPHEVEEWVNTYHSGWQWIETEVDGRLLLEEDPAVMSYRTEPIDGMIYGRDQVNGTPSLDDEALKADDEKFWEEISVWPEPWFSLVSDAMVSAYIAYDQDEPEDFDPLGDAGWFLKSKGMTRMIKPINELTDEQIERLEPYMVPGQKSVRLATPRKAKEDE